MPDNETHNSTPFFDIDQDVLAVATIQRLIAQNYSSSVMKLSRPKLNELGRRLLQPGQDIADAAVDWLNQIGHDLKRSSVYRFAQRFREVSEVVSAQMVDDYARSRAVNADAMGVTEGYENLEKQLVWIANQEIMRTRPGEAKTARLGAYLDMVSAAHKGRLDRDKLQLARDQANARAEKLQAEVDRLELENDKRRSELQRSIEAAKKDVQSAVEGNADKSMSEDQVIAILDRVMKGEAS